MDVQGHRGKAVWEQRDRGTGRRYGAKGQLELVTTDPPLDIDDTSPRKNYVLGGSQNWAGLVQILALLILTRDLGQHLCPHL